MLVTVHPPQCSNLWLVEAFVSTRSSGASFWRPLGHGEDLRTATRMHLEALALMRANFELRLDVDYSAVAHGAGAASNVDPDGRFGWAEAFDGLVLHKVRMARIDEHGARRDVETLLSNEEREAIENVPVASMGAIYPRAQLLAIMDALELAELAGDAPIKALAGPRL